MVCSKSPNGSAKGSCPTMFLSAATGRICRFAGRGTFDVSRAVVEPIDFDGDFRHRKGAARDRFVATAELRTNGGCSSGSAAGSKLEASSNVVVSSERSCRRRPPRMGRVIRLALATLLCGIVRTVVWCFLRDRDVMGVAFLDTGC